MERRQAERLRLLQEAVIEEEYPLSCGVKIRVSRNGCKSYTEDDLRQMCQQFLETAHEMCP